MTRAAGRKTGPTPSGVIARLKANLIARYGLANVPGRPDELRKPGTDRAVSVQYGTFQIRVRLLDRREWVSVFDLQVDTPDRMIRDRVFAVLDPWFEVMQGLGDQVHDVGTHGGPNRMVISTAPVVISPAPGELGPAMRNAIQRHRGGAL